MNRYFFALGLGPAFALGACGGQGNETVTTVDNIVASDTSMANDMDANAMAATMASPAQAFADAAGASDYYEVEAGKLAQEKASSQALKDFGGMMVTGHTESTEKLKAAGAAASPAITPNAVLNAEQEANLATLRSATGADFDAAYKTQQIAAHEKALAAIQDYAVNGDVPEIKAWAADTAKVVQMHLDKIKSL